MHINGRVFIDYETIELQPDGSTKASTEAYRDNFRVSTFAACWRSPTGGVESVYLIGEPDVLVFLRKLEVEAWPVICHNVQFEQLVTRCRFPGVGLNWHADTMRLAQLFDNGGDKGEFEYIVDPEWVGDESEAPIKKKPLSGLGLVVCNKRILGGKDHKLPAYEWIRANVPDSAGKEGSYLDRLPADLAESYNVADTIVTMELYEYITAEFNRMHFDWSLDWRLFSSTVTHLVSAKIKGVPVDRIRLKDGISKTRAEIEQIGRDFHLKFRELITSIEHDRIHAYIHKPGKNGPPNDVRMLKRRDTLLARGSTALKLHFNVGSNKQLAELFIDKLGIEPKFFTKKGAPGFKSSMLSQWGDGGEMLKKRRKLGIVLAQMENLLKLSEYDSLWHSDLRACGTSTSRFVGAS